MLRPLGKKILVQRLEGHGIERVTPGGVIIPATAEANVRTKVDYFRARVLVMGPEASRLVPDLEPGEEVLLYTYSGSAESVFTGKGTEKGSQLFVEPDDILCVVGAEVAA